MPTSPRPCHSEPVTVSLAWETVLPKRETDCRVASLLAMTRCVGSDDPACPNSAKRCHSHASDRVTGVGIRFPRTDKNWFRIFHKKEIIPISAQMTRITLESYGKNCQIRHFAQISRRMLADVPKFRKLREITCKRHAAAVNLYYTSLTTC